MINSWLDPDPEKNDLDLSIIKMFLSSLTIYNKTLFQDPDSEKNTGSDQIWIWNPAASAFVCPSF